MGEKGNLADVRNVSGHVPSATQTAHTVGTGLGGQTVGQAPPASGGGGGGGLLSDLADKAGDKITDVGLGRGGAAGIVNQEEDDDDET